MKKTNIRALCATGLLASFLMTASLTANAAIVYSDDFEDGDHVSWLSTSVIGQGGSGSTGVELHNSSQMAFVYHRGQGRDSLSHDFSYLATIFCRSTCMP